LPTIIAGNVTLMLAALQGKVRLGSKGDIATGFIRMI
jgi:hypothetical protein